MAKVLLVEDDNNLREIYEARLQAEGYSIVSAKDGEEALVIAKEEKPDLIISDVMMPKISGFEMLDILRNTEGLKDTKVIMLTALGQAEDQTRADKLGADRYLVKSQVTLEDIVKVSHDLLGEDTTQAANPVSDTQIEEQVPLASSAPVETVPVTATPMPEPTPVAEPPAIEPAANQTTPEISISPVPATTPADTAAQADLTMPQPAQAVDQSVVEPNQDSTVAQPISGTNIVSEDSTTVQTATPASSGAIMPEPIQPQGSGQPSANFDMPEISITADGQLAQTEAEESAAMDNKINEFLQTAAPAAPVEPTTPPVAQPATPQPIANPLQSIPSDQAAANDQTLAQAVNDLMSEEPQVQAETNPTPAVPPLTDAQPPIPQSEEVALPSASNDNPDKPGRKIIQPPAGLDQCPVVQLDDSGISDFGS